MKKLIILIILISTTLGYIFLNKNNIYKDEIKKEAKINTTPKIEKEEITKKEPQIKTTKKEHQIKITKKEPQIKITKKVDKFYKKAVNDLEKIYSEEYSLSKKGHLMIERKALILSQFLKVKENYENKIDSFEDDEYEKIYSYIDNSTIAYENLLNFTSENETFEDFFSQYQKEIQLL